MSGQRFEGRPAIHSLVKRILGSAYQNTHLAQELMSLRFVTPDVAVVETLTAVSGLAGRAAGLDASGRRRTLLLQVFVRRDASWTITTFHNVAVPPVQPIAPSG